jgi:N utilization substance protein B
VTAPAERRARERPRRELRRHAREAAVQMLYQWEIGGQPVEDVLRAFWANAPRPDPDAGDAPPVEPLEAPQRAFAETLTTGVARHVGVIDPMIADAAQHWRLERMAVIDRLILRLAVYEFLHEPETPGKVIINEALELARTFSTDDAVRFINGMLDGIRKSLERE